MISVILNGEPRQVREGSIADLVASLGLDAKKVAVERNRAIVPHGSTVIEATRNLPPAPVTA